MTPCLQGSQFNMKNPLNPEQSPLNQDPTGRNSMGSKFNPTLEHIVENGICFLIHIYWARIS